MTTQPIVHYLASVTHRREEVGGKLFEIHNDTHDVQSVGEDIDALL